MGRSVEAAIATDVRQWCQHSKVLLAPRVKQESVQCNLLFQIKSYSPKSLDLGSRLAMEASMMEQHHKHTPLPVMMCNKIDRLDILEPGFGSCRRDHRLIGAYTGNDHAARNRMTSC